MHAQQAKIKVKMQIEVSEIYSYKIKQNNRELSIRQIESAFQSLLSSHLMSLLANVIAKKENKHVCSLTGSILHRKIEHHGQYIA